ncbi:MAG: sulfur carrier protein ThiS adenylyltransferase ThiF [Candidatus Omnitrophota bacterium]
MNIFETGLLRYFQPEQLAIIQRRKIGIAGAGGLGSNICAALVRTGFKHIEILDKDIVEASNLNRQDYILADIGKPKVDCLKSRMLAINPDLQLTVHQREWTPADNAGLFVEADIIVEALDKADIKTQFVEYYAPRAPFVISGNGMSGLNTTTSATTVRKIGNIYLVGDGVTSIHDGHPALAPRVIQCAAKMAEVVLSLTIQSY